MILKFSSLCLLLFGTCAASPWKNKREVDERAEKIANSQPYYVYYPMRGIRRPTNPKRPILPPIRPNPPTRPKSPFPPPPPPRPVPPNRFADCLIYEEALSFKLLESINMPSDVEDALGVNGDRIKEEISKNESPEAGDSTSLDERAEKIANSEPYYAYYPIIFPPKPLIFPPIPFPYIYSDYLIYEEALSFKLLEPIKIPTEVENAFKVNHKNVNEKISKHIPSQKEKDENNKAETDDNTHLKERAKRVAIGGPYRPRPRPIFIDEIFYPLDPYEELFYDDDSNQEETQHKTDSAKVESSTDKEDKNVETNIVDSTSLKTRTKRRLFPIIWYPSYTKENRYNIYADVPNNEDNEEKVTSSAGFKIIATPSDLKEGLPIKIDNKPFSETSENISPNENDSAKRDAKIPPYTTDYVDGTFGRRPIPRLPFIYPYDRDIVYADGPTYEENTSAKLLETINIPPELKNALITNSGNTGVDENNKKISPEDEIYTTLKRAYPPSPYLPLDPYRPTNPCPPIPYKCIHDSVNEEKTSPEEETRYIFNVESGDFVGRGGGRIRPPTSLRPWPPIRTWPPMRLADGAIYEDDTSFKLLENIYISPELEDALDKILNYIKEEKVSPKDTTPKYEVESDDKTEPKTEIEGDKVPKEEIISENKTPKPQTNPIA